MIIGVEKSGKILENCNADLEKAGVYYTVGYPQFVTVNFLTVYDTKHLK